MATQIFLPRLGESVEEAVIGKWCKQVGDSVARGDVIAELETAKAMMELESPAKGVLLAVFPEIGQLVQMGELVAIVGKAGEDWEAELVQESGESARAEAPQSVENAHKTLVQSVSPDAGNRGGISIAPNAKRVAKELGIDWTEIPLETGITRITSEMVQKFAESKKAAPGQASLPGSRVALTKIQSITAKRMTQSAQTIPQFSVSMDISADRLNRFIHEQKNVGGAKITVTAVLIQKVAEALTEHPRLNAHFDLEADAIYEYRPVNIAVAAATPEGLYVPVLQGVTEMKLAQIAERLTALAEDARAGKLKYEDSVGATFTISNLGMKGVKNFTPIIDPGQAAILGVGGVHDELGLDSNGGVLTRKVFNLTVTADHRVADGLAVSEFLVTLKNLLENL